MYKYRRQRQNGWLTIEVLVTIAVIVVLMGTIAAAVITAGKGNRRLWAKQQAILAAEAQLDCLTAAGAALPQEQFERLWPGFSYEIRTLNTAAADGLEHVEVVVTESAGARPARAAAARMLPKREVR